MKAMIFAAGKGERMLPLTQDRPKPLLKINNKSLIEYHLEKIAAAGIQEVVVNVSWMADKIMNVVGDGRAYNLNIVYSQEPEPLETAGAILHAKSLLGSEPLLLVNADVYSQINYSHLIQKPLQQDCMAHLVLVPNPDHNPEGDYGLSAEGRVVVRSQSEQNFTFAGVSLFNPTLVYDYKLARTVFPLREVFAEAIRESKLSGELFCGLWSDVGTPQRMQALENELAV